MDILRLSTPRIAEIVCTGHRKSADMDRHTHGTLEGENAGERTHRTSQQKLRELLHVGSARRIFRLDLPKFGPYGCSWSRNGRWALLAGCKGHVAMVDMMRLRVQTELHVRETCRACSFLNNHTLYAVAQRKHVFVYDSTGAEVHRLRSHAEPHALDYLPFHFLLASVGRTGHLIYQDMSTGQLVADHRTKLGSCDVLRRNPSNSVLLLGHESGRVTMWSPSVPTPLVKMLCHKGPVTCLAVDHAGRRMATAGLDGMLRVFDLRMYRKMHSYFTPLPASAVDISQRGMLAVGFGGNVQIWKDALDTKATSPYLRHLVTGSAVTKGGLRFRPFADTVGVGHRLGFSSVVVPGAGEPNFDVREANPFESGRQRQEQEVVQARRIIGAGFDFSAFLFDFRPCKPNRNVRSLHLLRWQLHFWARFFSKAA